MARTPSTMPPLGGMAPDFSLPDADGQVHSRSDFDSATGLLVVFWCNHCPFVKHIRNEFVRFAAEYRERGLAVVAINSNAEVVPDDSPEAMREEVRRFEYGFPYLVDADQQVARAYQAACTPDFFLYDATRALVYRGQFDDSRPSLDVPVTGADLRAATDALLEGRAVPDPQRPSLGCNIKWKVAR